MTKLSLMIVAILAGSALAAPNGPDNVFQKSPIKDWTKKPAPTAEPRFKPPVAKRLKLANGMALLVLENKKLPIASFVLVAPGAGAAADPAGKGGLAAFTADLLDEGAGGLTALGIAEEQDRLGATIGVGLDVDAAVVQVNTLSRTLDASIDLMTKIVTQPAFDAKEFDRVRGDRQTSLDLRRDRPREVAGVMLASALYGADSAYGHASAGTRESFKGLSLADAKAFYADHWNPAKMTLVVAGDVDTAALKKKLDAGLGAWKPAGTKPIAKVDASAKPVGRRLLVVDRPGAAQTDVRIGLVGPGRKDKRYFEFEVLRTTLGDGFTSRLVQKLREEMGIVYGASASMDWRLSPGPFVIATAIQTPDTGRGLAEVIKILDDLSTAELTAAELEKSKQNIIRALPGMFDSNASTAAAFADLAHQGLPDTYYATYADAVRRVNGKQVKEAARTVIPSGKMAFALVGDLAKVKAELAKLGLGDAAMHDVYGIAK
ncbi:MAG: insulinase family protein [Deltaproteobacteria bacterium]|nr:insulinase family protein [Deltaproteobacteria bacterium]